jgi:hypothetical protein
MDDVRISQGALTPDQFLIHAAYTNAQLGISSQPTNVTLVPGQPAAFQVGVNVTNIPAGAVLYQWQSEALGGSQWVSIPGADLSSYEVLAPVLADSGTQYRVIITAPGGPSITSAVATLLGPPSPVGIAFTNGTVTLTWTSGILQQATQLIGPWQDVSGVVSPYSLAPSGSQMFFRIGQQ